MNKMVPEFSSGLAAEKDHVFPSCPADPEMRESVSLWFIEENGAFGIPRTGIEAEAKCWDDRMFQANMAFADGRVLIGPGRGAVPSPIDADGRPTIIGAGPLTFQCIDPFRRWTAHFDGDAADGQVTDQMAGRLDATRRTRVKFTVDMEMATPAWVQDNSATDLSKMTAAEKADAESMGIGYRFEHLFRATGTFEVDGVSRDFRGTGLRIHRQSARPLGGFRGHCWQSCLFPGGKAFGYIAYPPRDDGSVTYNDGYIYQDGRMIVARVVDAPWLRRIVPSGDDVSLTLESELGLTRIAGVTVLSTFRIGNPDLGGMHLQQSGVRYIWGDETAYGMIERSDQVSLISFG
jgi:prepilin-type processing-associated H-X9-DG protein